MKSLLAKPMHLAILLVLALCVSPDHVVHAQLSVYGPSAESLQNSAHSLFINSSGNFYNQNNNGNTGFNYWWNAHGVDALVDGYLRTRNGTYLTRMKNLVRGIKIRNGNTYDINYYDDMEWLAISSLRAYEETKDVEYLNVANELWVYIKTGKRGSSFQWKKDCPDCRNTCANTPAVIFAARRHRVTGNAEDLQIAKEVFAWMKSTLVDPATGAVWDAYNAGTGGIGKSRYSYNQGTYVGAALELYKLTGDITYMNDAVKTANYAISNQINGILYPNAGGGDGGLFNGILVRYLALLAREGNISQSDKDNYINIIRSSGEALRTQGIYTSNYTCSPKWGVPPTDGITEYSSQLSGVMLMEAAATFDQAKFYQHINYGGTSSGLTPGFYNLAALTSKGISDNDVTSLTVPAGLQVTVYENDNFTGASAVYTSNQTWLSSWNDRISSIRIAATCAAPGIVPYISVNNGSWQQTSAATVNLGSTVTIGPHPLDGIWSWAGPNGFYSTARQIKITNIQTNQGGTYRVTYYSNGCSSTHDFIINVNSTFTQKIEAENYSSASGVIKETCSEGGQNLGSFDAGNWASYQVTIPVSGTYKVTYRVSSIYSGKTLRLEKDAGAAQLGTVTVPYTTHWQIYTSVSHNVTLPAGTYSIGLATSTGGFNINWFEITNNLSSASARTITEESPEVVKEQEETIAEPGVYPNPFKNNVKVRVNVVQGGHTQVSILNILGTKLSDLHNGYLDAGVHEFEFNGAQLPAGPYVCFVIQRGKRSVQKMIKE